MSKHLKIIAGSALLAIAALAPAGAQEREMMTVRGAPVIRVSYADLNLQSRRGLEALNRRVTQAAETLCNMEESRLLAIAVIERICVKTAVSGAQPQIEAARSRTSLAAGSQYVTISASAGR